LNGLDLQLDVPTIKFEWEGFGSKSFPKEPSLPLYTFAYRLENYNRINIKLLECSNAEC